MSAPLLRPARPSDGPFLLALCERFKEHGLPPWRDRERALAFHASEERALLRALSEGETVLVADWDGAPAGFIHLKTDRDFLTGEAQGYIAEVAVTPDAEGRGVAKALMQAAEDWCRSQGHRVLTLDVFAANVRARTFYERLGFLEQTLKLAKPLEGPGPVPRPQVIP